jgi:hypothetical protein
VEKADKINFLNPYPQAFQSNQRNTNTSIPQSRDCQNDTVEFSTKKTFKKLTLVQKFLNKINPYFQSAQQKHENTSIKTPVITMEQFQEQIQKIPSGNENIFADISKVKHTCENIVDTAKNLQQRINALDSKIEKQENSKGLIKAMLAFFGWIIPFRRVTSVPDKVDNNDYVGTAGTIAVAGCLLPEDLRDTRDGVKQVLSKALPRDLQARIAKKSRKFYKDYIRYKTKYDPKDYQTEFSFIRGTFIQPLVNKIGGKIGYYLHLLDKPLLLTSFGEKLMNLLHVKRTDRKWTGREIPRIIIDSETGKYIKKMKKVYAYKLEGPAIGKLICRALQRTTVYGSLALSAIAIPSIIMSINKSKNTEGKLKNGSKQTLKAIISVTTTLAGIGIGGALLAPIGAVGSVVGMALGSALSAYISSQINKNIK